MKRTNPPTSYSLESWISSPTKKKKINLPNALLVFTKYLQNELKAKCSKYSWQQALSCQES